MDSIGKILLLVSLVHAYVFAVLFFTSKRSSTKVMGYYMLNVFIQYFLFLNVQTYQIEIINLFFYYLIIPLSLSSHPLIYLYVKHLTEEHFRYTKKTLLHFLPATLLFLLAVILIPSLSPEEKQALLEEKSIVEMAMNPVIMLYNVSTLVLFGQMIAYSVSMIVLLIQHDKKIEEVHSNKQDVSLFWLKGFVYLYAAYYLFEFVLFVFKGISISETAYFSIIALHVFFLGLMAYKQKDVYLSDDQVVSLPDTNKVETDAPNPISETQVSPATPQIQHLEIIIGDLSKEDKKILLTLQQLMQHDKIYLNADLSLYELANQLKTKKNHLSTLINEQYGMNFFNYINYYRIEEAKILLSQADQYITSIENIAQSVGFKSRSVFNPVFKRIVGETPSQFRKKWLSQQG